MCVGCSTIAYQIFLTAISLHFYALFHDSSVNNVQKFKSVLHLFLKKMNNVTTSWSRCQNLHIVFDNSYVYFHKNIIFLGTHSLQIYYTFLMLLKNISLVQTIADFIYMYRSRKNYFPWTHTQFAHSIYITRFVLKYSISTNDRRFKTSQCLSGMCRSALFFSFYWCRFLFRWMPIANWSSSFFWGGGG